MIHTLAFASEGPPNDEGLPLGKGMIEEWKKMCFEGGTTTFRAWTPHDFLPEDRWAVKKYSRAHVMRGNPVYSNIGLGAWKAVMFRIACDSSQDGDIIFYHDINFKKYPDTKIFARNLRQCVMNILEHTDFYMPPHTTVGNHCGQEVIKFFVKGQDQINEIARAPLGRGRIFVFKINPRTRRFIRDAEDILKKNPLLLSPVGKTGHPEFRLFGSTAEQAFFTVFAYSEGLFPLKWKGTWIERLRNVGLEPGSGVSRILRLNNQGDLENNSIEFILGSPLISDFSSAIIIEGPYTRGYTENTIRIFVERNPRSLIIVSTFAPAEESCGEQVFGNFLSNFDKQNAIFIFIKSPAKDMYHDFWKTNIKNQNLQRLASFIGVRYAHELNIPVCLKVRSDAFLGRPNICEYLHDEINLHPLSLDNEVKLKSRVVVSDRSRELKDYFIFDQWIFGSTEDLMRVFDIRPGCAWEEGRGIRTDSSPEKHLTECWMKNVGLFGKIKTLFELASKFLVVVDSIEIEFICQRYENYIRYLLDGKKYIKEKGPKFFNVDLWKSSLRGI